MKPIRILIVDDHAILRMGLTSILGTKSDLEVVGDASGGKAALGKLARTAPDVAIVDLMMPGMDGAETTARIRAARPGTRVLILTTFGTSDGIARALAAGADGAILKNTGLDELHRAIRAVAAGRRYLSPEISRIMENDPPAPSLTPRQQHILESIARGLTSADIAKELGISFDMVREHTKALLQKIGAANRTEAVAIAMRKHLLKM